MSNIFIESKPVSFGSNPFDHLYLVYKNDAGEEFVIRSGPTFDLPPFGDIDMEDGILMSLSKDNRDPSQAVSVFGQKMLDLGNRNAEDVWHVMTQYANNIQSAAVSYDSLTQNSNSVIASMLYLVGIDLNDFIPANTTATQLFAMENLLLDVVRDIGGSNNNDFIIGGDNGDILAGEGGNDTLDGRGGDDTLAGNAGDDTILGSNGDDFIDGGSGVDVVDYSGLESLFGYNVLADLGAGTVLVDQLLFGTDSTQQLSNIEHVITGDGFDALTAGDTGNHLEAGGGTAEYVSLCLDYVNDNVRQNQLVA